MSLPWPNWTTEEWIEKLGAEGQRFASSRETLVHKAADSHVAKLSIVFRYAFAMARKALKEEFRTAGGKGSGNFSHAGRPGEVGGSGEGFDHAQTGKPITFTAFHHTTTANATRMESGDVKDTLLYVSDDKKAWASPWLKGDEKQVPVQFTVRMKNPVVHTSKEGTFEEHGTKWIRQAKKEGRDGLIYVSKERTFGKVRQAILFRPTVQVTKSSIRTAGGPGSGGFGHRGRPGQIGGSSSTGESAPRREDPTLDQIRQVHEMLASGMSSTAIATKMGWGGKSGSRGQIVKDVAARYNPDGTSKEGYVKEQPPQKALPPRDATQPPPPVDEGKIFENREGGSTVWRGKDGTPVNVVVQPGVHSMYQLQAKSAIGHVSDQVLRSAGKHGVPPTIYIENQIVCDFTYGSQKEKGWQAAGQYWHGQNKILLSAESGTNERVLNHELGHGLAHSNMRLFGRGEVRQAFREDRHDLVMAHKFRSNDPTDRIKLQGYNTLAYYRASWGEAFAETTAQHLTPIERQGSDWSKRALIAASFPRMWDVVGKGLAKVAARKKRS